MNKALHVLVYVFLALAGAALFFELQLNAKRSLIADRNGLQEEFLIQIARTIEKDEPNKETAFELQKDVSPVEAKLVDSPEYENLLEGYNGYLEQPNLATYDWDNMPTKNQLRTVYVLDFDGKPVMDGTKPLMKGNGTEHELLSKLYESAKDQQSRLNTTRAELTSLRGKFEEAVKELNDLKPVARQDKVTIVERDEKIAKLETEKADLEDQITKKKAEIEELNADIASKNDEISAQKDKIEERDEIIEKNTKLIAQLQKLLRDAMGTAGNRAARGTAVASVPVGDKGTIVEADNENMFAIVKFTDEAMKELKGEDDKNALPALEFGVRRTGFKGEAGEFVGRIRLRQEVKGKNFVICDILSSWEQDKLQPNDIIFAD